MLEGEKTRGRGGGVYEGGVRVGGGCTGVVVEGVG